MATSFEERQTKAFEAEAFTEVRTEHAKYFEAISAPPRALVGKEVPSLTGPGMERLRDSADARDWQESAKQMLIAEVASRVEKRKEDARDVFATVHASIDLFRNNADLIPGTKTFDRDLANALATSLKDYELKANGKLIGYSVPVQPIINALRSQLVAQRAAQATQAAAPPAAATGSAAAAGAAAGTASAAAAGQQPRGADGRWEGPQAGLTSKAGQSASPDDDIAAGVLSAFMRQNGMRI